MLASRYDPVTNQYVTFDTAVANRLRIRVAAANLTTLGFTLLAGLAGWKYRIADCNLIAIGGNATSSTSVIITATQSAAPVNLFTAPIAGLTRSSVLRAGAATVTVLADGASFVANDAGAGIGVAIVGAAMTVMTFLDIDLVYLIEP